MKTTMVLDEGIFGRLRQEAIAEGRTVSELVEAALRLFFQRKEAPPKLPPLPVSHGGGLLVNVADRAALYAVLDGDRDAALIAREPPPGYGAGKPKRARKPRSGAKRTRG